jgi:hypothetical protein
MWLRIRRWQLFMDRYPQPTRLVCLITRLIPSVQALETSLVSTAQDGRLSAGATTMEQLP